MIDQKRSLSPLWIVLILSTIFFLVFLLVSGALLFSKPSKSVFSTSSGSVVGVIEINGVIFDSKKILQRLEAFEEDDSIKAIVLRLNSPGGSVAPSQEIFQAVRRYKKPVVASMASAAASGAYYIACGAKKIFANPGSITGSIGVIMEFVNLGKLYEWAKIQRYSLVTGKFKGAGAEYKELTPEQKALFQGMIDDVLYQFKVAVSEGRKLPMAQVNAIADGRIFSGSQAKAAKLVDELGSFQDAINEAAKLGKIKGKPTVVYPAKHKRRWLDLILDGESDEERSEASGAESLLGSFIQKILGYSMSSQPFGKTQIHDFAPGMYWLWNGAH